MLNELIAGGVGEPLSFVRSGWQKLPVITRASIVAESWTSVDLRQAIEYELKLRRPGGAAAIFHALWQIFSKELQVITLHSA
jgi:hypothetical protein